MLAKVFRFHGHGSLKYLYSKGTQVRSKHLSIKYVKNERRDVNRCTVIVSKKVSKQAPLRNRIRRRVYEVVQGEWQNLKTPYDIVVTVFDENIATMPAPELTQLVKNLLIQARLL